MTCYTPITGYRAIEPNESGKRSIVFDPKKGHFDQPIKIPCGVCDGCKKSYTRAWAIRCVNEASCWEKNAFITLTYNEEHLPVNGTLKPDHFTNFMKYLREENGPGIRFYGCGEYGEKGKRPHYHILLFNYSPSDKELFGVSKTGKLYTSESIAKLWKKGFNTVGEVTWESACYTARYVMKKTRDPEEYRYLDIEPEFVRMSRRPGIGAFYYEKYKNDIWATDSIVVNKRSLKPPKFYQDKLERENNKRLEELKNRRARRTKKVDDRRLHNMFLNQQIRKKKAEGKRSYET